MPCSPLLPERDRQSRPRWPRSLKLDPAAFHVCFLLDRDHLALHLRELGGRLLVAPDKECSRPEDDDGGGRRETIVGPLLILDTGQRGRPRGDRLGLLSE